MLGSEAARLAVCHLQKTKRQTFSHSFHDAQIWLLPLGKGLTSFFQVNCSVLEFVVLTSLLLPYM